jgi:hypothetical protein
MLAGAAVQVLQLASLSCERVSEEKLERWAEVPPFCNSLYLNLPSNASTPQPPARSCLGRT